MANSLLDYRGDPGLGAGSNPNIGVAGPNSNFNQINRTLENVMLIDADRNTKKWQQSIKDRDTTNQLIADGQVAVGAASPEDRKLIDAQQKVVEKAYLDNPDILYNPQAFAKYTEEKGKLQEVVNQAQMRWKGLAELKSQKANNPYPWEQDDIQKHIDAQSKKGFWDTIDPYQKTFDIDMSGILGYAKPLTKSNVDTKDPLKSTNETYFDFPSIYNAAKNDFIAGGKEGYNQTAFYNKIQGLQPKQLAQFVDSTNAQIKKYNDERSIAPGSPGYVQPVQSQLDEKSGNIILQETAPDLAAKTALAAQNQFSVKTSSFKAEDLLKHGEKEQEIGIQRQHLGLEAQNTSIALKKLGMDQERTDAYAKHLEALDKKGGANPQLETDVKNKWGQIQQGVQFGATIAKGKTHIFKANDPDVKADITDVSNLPDDYQYLSGPIIDPKTHKVSVARLIPFETEDGKQYYKNKYVDPTTGTSVDVYDQTWKDGYKDWQTKGFKGSYEDYLKTNLEKNAFQLVLEGQYPQTDAKGQPIKDKYKTGRATLESFYNSERFINDQATHGKEDVVDTPPSE